MSVISVDSKLVAEYISSFFGHGNLNSSIWFIGKEHGGDNDFQSKIQRFIAWDELGRNFTIDSIQYGKYVEGHDKWHRTGKIQATWGKLIQFVLAYDGLIYSKESVSDFQIHSFGLDDSNHCILELMPLAAKSSKDWIYAEHLPNIPFLKDRKTYFAEIAPKRAQKLRYLIEQNNPKVVLFYSTDGEYLPYWNHIANTEDWKEIEIRSGFKVKMTKENDTVFLVTPHPTRHGIRGEDFPSLARLAKSL